jgi:glycosyltransferase involved in cell wall biosynthesis
VPAPLRPLVRALLARVRRADAAAAADVTAFIAASRHVADRIARCYGRSADVVHPPVDTGFFTPDAESERGSARGDPADTRPYLLLGEMVPYKRFAVGVRACRELDRPLIVAGGGPERRALVRLAGSRTRFVHRPDDAGVRALYRSCRALLYPGEEDFGLVPLEAMACGRPVVALGRGGALETVADGATGVLYAPAVESAPELEAEVAALRRGMLRFESIEHTLDPRAAVAHARRHSPERFREELSRVLARVVAGGAERADASRLRPASRPA